MGLDIANLGDIDSDKVGHLRKVLAQRTKLVGIHIVNVIWRFLKQPPSITITLTIITYMTSTTSNTTMV